MLSKEKLLVRAPLATQSGCSFLNVVTSANFQPKRRAFFPLPNTLLILNHEFLLAFLFRNISVPPKVMSTMMPSNEEINNYPTVGPGLADSNVNAQDSCTNK